MSRALFLIFLAVSTGCSTASAEPRPPALDPLAAEREAAATDPAHQPHETGEGVALGDRAHVSAEGASIAAGAGRIRIALAAFGREGALDDVASAAPTTEGPEVRIARAPGLVEWWRSLPSGLEQGVTIDTPPAGDGPLVLEMSVGEGVVPESAGPDVITLREAGSARALGTYSGLVVLDADGMAIPARMAPAGERIHIEIDDAGARYPLTVDPLVVVREHSETLPFSIGADAAISGDGTRALIAGRGVLRRDGAAWAQEEPTASGDYTRLVALDEAGARAVRGSPECGSCPPRRLVVSRRSGTAWSHEFSDEVRIGALAIDDAGATIAASVVDGVRVYLRAGTSWILETTLAAASSPPGEIPDRLALSGDGSRIVVVVSSASLVYARTGTGWSLERSLPGVSGAVDLDRAGERLVWGRGDTAHVLLRTGTLWVEEGSIVLAGGLATIIQSVAIDAGGSLVAVGASSLSFSGETVLARRISGSWTRDASLSCATSYALDLSSGGERAICGQESSVAYIDAVGAPALACSRGTDCASGFCVDGVCCSSACGGGATDCMACSAAAGSREPDGACAPLRDVVAPTVTCRPASRACDRAEVCTSASVDCPADSVMPGGSVCREAAGLCDSREVCDGTSFDCAADVRVPAGTPCGGATGGSCATSGVCDGASSACPGAAPLMAGHVCLPRDPASPCDVDDVCDGVSQECQPRYASVDTSCGPPATEACDAPDHCSGTSADCIAVYLDGVVCRPLQGACDAAETCTGDSPGCPADARLPAGLVCNPSTEACDPAEACDGTGPLCPANVTCPVDAGPAVDGGAGLDAAAPSAPDAAGATPAATGGCACRAGRAAPQSAGWAWVSALLALAGALRRRRPA